MIRRRLLFLSGLFIAAFVLGAPFLFAGAVTYRVEATFEPDPGQSLAQFEPAELHIIKGGTVVQVSPIRFEIEGTKLVPQPTHMSVTLKALDIERNPFTIVLVGPIKGRMMMLQYRVVEYRI